MNKAEDFAFDLRTIISNNMIDCEDSEVVGTRVERVEPIEPGKFEVKRMDGTKFVVTVVEV